MMFPSSAPGFDDPIGMLAACHERILSRCALLGRLVVHWQQQGLNSDVRAAAADVVAYFSRAGHAHHQDEEQDLFPLLRADPDLADTLDSLSRGHRELDSVWSELEPLLSNPDSVENCEKLMALADRFCTSQTQHVEIENREVLPRARELLPPQILVVVGSRMAARRGINL